MEFFNNILCISGTELIKSDANPAGVMSLSYYTNLVSQNRLNRIRRATRENPALIEFDSLPSKYKTMIEQIHPDPRKEAIAAPFIARIKTDPIAREIFSTYTYDGGKTLPDETVERYCNDAAIFNALAPIVDTMSVRRTAQGLTRSTAKKFGPDIWVYAMECVDSVRERYDCTIPHNVRVLRRKFESYVAEGYSALIHKGFGNMNKNVIKGPIAEAVLLTMFRDGRQQSDVVVAEAFNKWAVDYNHPTITARAVTDYRIKNADRITLQREGESVWRNRFDQVIRRSRPSTPLMLINSDDNDLDLYYRHKFLVKSKTGKTKLHTTEYYRYKIYVVLDAHCDYILGWAAGPEITKELIREAYRNAMNHVRQLTGAYHLWDQVIADRWGLNGDLKKFFTDQGDFIPPKPGQARPKVIERSFGTEWHRELKRNFKNYAGHNITAKEKHNADWVKANKANFPLVGKDAIAQIDQFIEIMRNVEWKKSGRSRREVWLANFTAMGVSAEHQISDLTYLTTFGEKHTHLNRVNSSGLTVTIDGVKRVYDIPDEMYRSAIGKQVQVQYDPSDMSRVLLTDGEKLRFVASENIPMPMALADMKLGDRTRLNEKLNRKERRILDVIDEASFHASELARLGIDADSYLQSGNKKKEDSFAATAIAAIPIERIQERQNIYNLMHN